MKCRSCYKFIEDWRDAKRKGYTPVRMNCGFYPYAHRARPGIEGECTEGRVRVPIDGDDEICRYWKPRLIWNMQVWWEWQVRAPLVRWFERHIRVPLGGLRKPMTLKWTDNSDCLSMEKESEPICPYCGNAPCSIEQCMFCGQRFIVEEIKK